MHAQTERWLAFAREDLRSARILLSEGIYGNSCFHAQQTVEKALKAVLVEQGAAVPRVHAIITLAQLMPKALTDQFSGDVSIFDDYYIPIRYPDALPGGLPDGPPALEDATEAITLASNVYQAVIASLSTSVQ